MGYLRVAPAAVAAAGRVARLNNAQNAFGMEPWRAHLDLQRRAVHDDIPGDRFVRNILTTLRIFDERRTQPNESPPYARSYDQRALHRAIIASSLQQLYSRQTLMQHLPRLLREFDVDELKLATMANWPRRWGKTWSVAQIAATFVYAVPDFEVIIYSTSQETSTNMLDTVLMKLRFIDASCVVRHSKKRVIVNSPLHGTQNLVLCYPCSEKVSF